MLAYLFTAPWLVIFALMAQTHALNRFRDSRHDEEEEEAQPMGFTDNVK